MPVLSLLSPAYPFHPAGRHRASAAHCPDSSVHFAAVLAESYFLSCRLAVAAAGLVAVDRPYFPDLRSCPGSADPGFDPDSHSVDFPATSGLKPDYSAFHHLTDSGVKTA